MWKLQALLYSFLIPKEFGISIGILNLSPYRVLLLLFFPWVLWQLINHRKFKWQALDTVAFAICLWPMIALNFSTNFLAAIESGGILFLETFVPFFATRLLVYRHQHLRTLSKTLLIVASILAISALPEAITGTPYAHNFASLITGKSFTFSPENRFGLWRSHGLTDHPIILGSICATALPIGFSLIRQKLLAASMTGLSFLGVIASASSGPLLSIVVQATLYIWSQLTKGKRYKWWILILFISLLYIFIDILSNRDPLRVMFSYLLFSEHNGYVRYNMWLNSFFLASQSFQSFFFGYGFSTEMMSLLDNMFWTTLMSKSVDSYWMVILLRYGAPMVLLSLLLIVLVLRANIANYRKQRHKSKRNLLLAWLIAATSLSLVACTVHFWGSTLSLFFVVLGGTTCTMKKRQKALNLRKPYKNAKTRFGARQMIKP